jgi:hypothetical protein
MRGFLFYMRLWKGFMKAGLAALPYSRKALRILADSLKVHQSMIWLDPVTNKISVKQLSLKEREVSLRNNN